jgi:hypothetical protein
MAQVMRLIIVTAKNLLVLQKNHVKQRLVILDLCLEVLVIVQHLLVLQEQHAKQQQLESNS